MKYKKWLILGCLFLDTVFISGCHVQGNERSNNQESTQQEAGMKQEEISKGVLESFEYTLKYYPTPKIEDVLDENMGKQAIIETNIGRRVNNKDDTPLISTGMVLYVNTSTKRGYGYYFEDQIYKGPESNDIKKKYPVIYDRGIHLKKSTGDPELDDKINHFQFLFQYADLKDLSKQKLLKADYNPEVPLFSAEYQLSNGDALVKKLRKDYGFDQKKAPILVLDGRGDYEGMGINDFDYRSVDIYFSRNPQHSVSSSVDYTDDVVEEGNY